ncbi:hypothetical protein [Anditalea andensis]|uniref:Outer membrane protein beta-barrel domain-containing protein n=1 Tax=Anditalea andensis TaxID=1048983 RepID=A0A074KY85_9BACT|nr:hypothetical protein [Anditalea andensis]KEO73919.1 hypothetical protein EL17_10510 [Anditalea andensis]
MMKHLLVAVAMLITYQAQAQFTFDVESGLAFQGYNNVRIPNQGGTSFNFTRDFDAKGLVIPFRLRVGYTFNEKNHIFGLFAPLNVNYEGAAPFDIAFQNSTFGEGENIDGFYKFNSYRLTYRRDIVSTDRWVVGIGFTAKIRDASVRLTSENGTADRKDDVGFVPLLHLFTAYQLPGCTLFLEGDGLAGGPGRAFDFFLGGKLPVYSKLDLKAGYRILEGGADVDEVYNFTLINFASIGLILTL